MHPRLQELIDHHDIRQLLATYCHGCDRADEVEMASTYAEDSLDDHGPRKLPGKPFSIATVADLLQTTDLVSHLLGQSLIKVDGRHGPGRKPISSRRCSIRRSRRASRRPSASSAGAMSTGWCGRMANG